jgi:3-hydroxypropanoate dehydrogenase
MIQSTLEETVTTASEEDIKLLFLDARTHSVWVDRPVDDQLLRRIYELARMPPTGANSQPLRVVFVRSRAAKEKLRPALSPGNVDKTMNAPATAIVAYDTEFYEKLPVLGAGRGEEMRAKVAGLPAEVRARLAYQGSSLQGGYLILAARALGLDCGPMGGFDNAQVDAAFFPDGKWKSNFLINLGYGDGERVHPRNPRLTFDEACRIE